MKKYLAGIALAVSGCNSFEFYLTPPEQKEFTMYRQTQVKENYEIPRDFMDISFSQVEENKRITLELCVDPNYKPALFRFEDRKPITLQAGWVRD